MGLKIYPARKKKVIRFWYHFSTKNTKMCLSFLNRPPKKKHAYAAFPTKVWHPQKTSDTTPFFIIKQRTFNSYLILLDIATRTVAKKSIVLGLKFATRDVLWSYGNEHPVPQNPMLRRWSFPSNCHRWGGITRFSDWDESLVSTANSARWHVVHQEFIERVNNLSLMGALNAERTVKWMSFKQSPSQVTSNLTW